MLRYGLLRSGISGILIPAKASAAGNSLSHHRQRGAVPLLQDRTRFMMSSATASAVPAADHQANSTKRQSSPAPAVKRRKIEATQTLGAEEGVKQNTKKVSAAEGSWHARVQEYKERMGVQEVPDVAMPKSESSLDFSKGLWLAPMVRIGTLPTRLIALEHGADLVWGPEIVDRAIIGTQRIVNERTGLIQYVRNDPSGNRGKDSEPKEREIFSTHPVEKPYLIYQIGCATPSLAYAAVQHVAEDVAGVDLNCGCPKPFSTHGGMGSNLLSTPELLCEILVAMRKAAPPRVSVTCKIRLLPTQELTFELVRKIVRTGTVDAITVHCRTKEMRPREKALSVKLKEVAQVIREESNGKVAVAVNGDCWDPTEAERIMQLTGVTAAMIARGAEANPSVFRREGPPLSICNIVAPQWIRYAAIFDNPFGNTKYCINQLAVRPHLKAAGPNASKAEQSKPISQPYEGEEEGKMLSRPAALELKQKMTSAKTLESMGEAFGVDVGAEKVKEVEEILRPLVEALKKRSRHE